MNTRTCPEARRAGGRNRPGRARPIVRNYSPAAAYVHTAVAGPAGRVEPRPAATTGGRGSAQAPGRVPRRAAGAGGGGEGAAAVARGRPAGSLPAAKPSDFAYVLCHAFKIERRIDTGARVPRDSNSQFPAVAYLPDERNSTNANHGNHLVAIIPFSIANVRIIQTVLKRAVPCYSVFQRKRHVSSIFEARNHHIHVAAAQGRARRIHSHPRRQDRHIVCLAGKIINRRLSKPSCTLCIHGNDRTERHEHGEHGNDGGEGCGSHHHLPFRFRVPADADADTLPRPRPGRLT